MFEQKRDSGGKRPSQNEAIRGRPIIEVSAG
jgi:hypothetical protein